MIVYGDPKTSVTVREALAALEGLQGEDLLVAEGMLEQGLADAGMEAGEQLPPDLPHELRIDLKTPEGFAFYHLNPDQYRRAARRWLRTAPRSGPVVVIGLRSIGTTLSRVVCEELRAAGVEVRRCTVRPEGDPFRRETRLPVWINCQADAYFVVDEGPGLSGSSFLSTVLELERRGIERSRIHFFPSHNGQPGSASSPEMRTMWQEITRWVEPPQWPALDEDKSWKYIGPPLPWPFDCSGEAERCARRNAELSFGLPILAQQDWWLAFPKVDCESAEVAPEMLARHIAAVADEPLRPEDELETEARLREMLLVNATKYFQDAHLTKNLQRWLDTLTIFHGGKSSGDGHLAPANWVRDREGKLWKLNTTGSKLSHLVACRLPVLWDVAQTIVEWNFDAKTEAEFCKKMEAENLPFERRDLEFFKLAVAAFELGNCVIFGHGNKAKYENRLLQGANALPVPR